MKKVIYIILPLFVTLSCNKKEVDSLTFNVVASSDVVKVGDTVNFTFSGNPYFITFYSGERGHKYEYRERTVAQGNPYFSFTSYRQYGNADSTLRVFVSTDFSGSYTRSGVDSAHWSNITGLCILSTGSDNTASGKIDLTPYTSTENKPIHLAFRYIDSNKTTNLRSWTISNFVVSNTLTEDLSTVTVIPNAYSAGFSNVNYSSATNVWIAPANASASLKISGGATGSPANENMAISTNIYLSTAAPDTAIAIKEISNTLTKYAHAFQEAGTYNVTFVGINEDAYGKHEMVKTIRIKVE